MVIFGASGDLTKRKLLPALYNLRKAGLLSDQFAIVGAARSPMTDDEFRRKAKEDLDGCDEGHSDAAVVDWLVLRLHYMALDAADPSSYRQSSRRGLLRSTRTTARRQCPLLPGDRTRSLSVDGTAARRRGADRGRGRSLAPRCRREAVRPRPRIGAHAQPRPAGGARRDAALSHRPLPGQRDRSEHPGVPLRQRHLRADLEPPLHRSRADHRCRNGRRRRRAAATTTRPARCGTWCRITCFS